MHQPLKIYNSLSGQKDLFKALSPPHVGMYACGPTVYSNVHLGNCRTFTCFDVIFRYLTHIGYKVRYVRNITDVGHLTNDDDNGEDKIARKAKLENIEPMEVAHHYTNNFHQVMQQLNNLPPSIEPVATGHIIEQIKMVEKLLEKGWAYETNGSVYFDLIKYHRVYSQNYGQLSGRVIEELLAGQHLLERLDEKQNIVDFALWKKANRSHIMRWDSPWGKGFPGWHLECSVMSSKYLGKYFDIHGGGMDLKFPHHECEIAQSQAANGQKPVNYWIHANMLTINGQKMSKSVGNVILPEDLFTGNHALLTKAYTPMVLRFAILQTHYRSTMDISNQGLSAATKGYKKLMNGLKIAKKMTYQPNDNIEKTERANQQIQRIVDAIYRGMNDDFNTAVSIAALFNLLKKINAIHTQSISVSVLSEEMFNLMKKTYIRFIEGVLGLKEESPYPVEKAIEIIMGRYQVAKNNKDYKQVDTIRMQLKGIGVILKDMKNGIEWAYEE